MKKQLVILVLLIFGLGFWEVRARASGPCSGEIYNDHPALVQECLHQQYVNARLSYPPPNVDYIPQAYPWPDSSAPPTLSIPFLPTATYLPQSTPKPTPSERITPVPHQ